MEQINPSILDLLWQGILQTSVWEWIAVATSVIYVVLAAKRSILCWIFALISSACYIYICFLSKLYIETILQFFYFGMGIVGWVLWNRPKDDSQEITTWGMRNNIVNILLSGLLTVILGYVFDTYTDQANPYVDAFITSYCLSATYMITKKVHEGWIYLILIDLLSIFLYGGRGLYVSSGLYIMFTVIAIFGWIEWFRKYRNPGVATSRDLIDA